MLSVETDVAVSSSTAYTASNTAFGLLLVVLSRTWMEKLLYVPALLTMSLEMGVDPVILGVQTQLEKDEVPLPLVKTM